MQKVEGSSPFIRFLGPFQPGCFFSTRLLLREVPRLPWGVTPADRFDRVTDRDSATVELYWIPLGAGGWSVRLNGRAFEVVAAAIGRRPRKALFHSALIVSVGGDRFTIEQTPVPRGDPRSRGVVASGAVGSALVGRIRLFRYEIRCWPGGEIPDIAEAVESPKLLSTDGDQAQRIVDSIREVPTPVWGRDELETGEMWNSNSVISWLLVRAGIDTQEIDLPSGGRAPGWDAGQLVAQRAAASSA